MQEQMTDVLKSLGIAGSCIRAEQHRHLAFFDVELEKSASALSKLQRSVSEIALHMRTKTIPTTTMVPEKGIIRLQVAMKEASPIKLNLLYSGEVIPTQKMIFPLLLGEDDTGKKLWMDMNNNPHLIVGGGTGSGKSTLLHTIIGNCLYLTELRARNVYIFLSDLKRVEFTKYDPEHNHFMKGRIQGLASSYEEIIKQLEFINKTMDRRYKMMCEKGMRSIEERPNEFPLILSVVDEVSDLMGQQKKDEVEKLIVNIAQKGRACGIYMILSTQRPSVDVITGLIKANFPGRIACRTASRKDSEIILDRPGAENLLGRGDAIMQNLKIDSVRFQVAYIEPQEVINTVRWFRNQANNEY